MNLKQIPSRFTITWEAGLHGIRIGIAKLGCKPGLVEQDIFQYIDVHCIYAQRKKHGRLGYIGDYTTQLCGD